MNSSGQAQRASHSYIQRYSHRVDKLNSLWIIAILLLPHTTNELTPPQRARISVYEVARSHGYNYKQWKCLDNILTKEAHYNIKAKTGSHYGIGQIKNLGHKPLALQITRILKYIKHRYTTACKAWTFHKQHNWY